MSVTRHPVTPAKAGIPGRDDAGLSPRGRELWIAALRYRRLADVIAAEGARR